MHGDAAREADDWLDLTGLMPPLPRDATNQILGKHAATDANASGSHTYLPLLVSETEFRSHILPRLYKSLSSDLVRFIEGRVSATFRLRKTLLRIKAEIEEIVGHGNFSALWLDRTAFSSDSMEHRALVTEAVIHVYSSEALGRLVGLLYRNEVPMIPYGEGGGYNMGVTPMAPAVTISLRGIDHISPVRPSRRRPDAFEVTVGAGVPFKDLQAYLGRRGFVIRCDPNTPRAATGGIVATGSNGGRKIFEVVLEGRAVTASGSATRFASDAEESKAIESEPFLMAHKFFSVTEENFPAFSSKAKRILSRQHEASISAECRNITVPLIGPKAAVNMAAQKYHNSQVQSRHVSAAKDPLASEATLPISCFVGAEGCTGFIYEVTLECERPQDWICGTRFHFTDVATAMAVTRSVKELPLDQQPVFFEIITGESIRRFLLEDFPAVFSLLDEAVLFVGIEARSSDDAKRKTTELIGRATAVIASGSGPEALRSTYTTPPEHQPTGRPSFEAMIKPREELPKKLRTKCKTDMEIRTEYLADVLRLVNESQAPRSDRFKKQDVMFGHLTPRRTAIIHWNIGGFDLYDEESAHAAWDYLEGVISKAQTLAPPQDAFASASFSGEHGIAGKAAFLWLNHLEPKDFHRMCLIKDTLDPKGLYNPETLFLRTSVARSLRARLIAFGAKQLTSIAQEVGRVADKGSLGQMQNPAANDATAQALTFATEEALRCTRCNSCKICPVIDAEHELRRDNPRGYKDSVLPSKRNLVMFLEWVAALSKSSPGKGAGDEVSPPPLRAMFKESARLLSKCFYCRKCDKACPVDINIHPMMKAFQTIGNVRNSSPFVFRFLTERLMGEDSFKDLTYKIGAIVGIATAPMLRIIRRIRFIPDWAKTYLSPPRFSYVAYEPSEQGIRLQPEDNYLLVSPIRSPQRIAPIRCTEDNTLNVFIRYRGCMDTYANPAASLTTDTFFRNVLGAEFVDLEKKMCCGFPFQADGLEERAKQSRFLSLVEIYKCVASILSRTQPTLAPDQSLAMLAALDPTSHRPPALRFTVFSNCPTCTEAIREMQEMLIDPEIRARLRATAKLPQSFSFEASEAQFAIMDTAEVAITLLEAAKAAGVPLPESNVPPTTLGQRAAAATGRPVLTGIHPNPVQLRSPIRSSRHVGLKVPCHNTPQATSAQLKLLGLYYEEVSAYDRCCGLSGTGRLKHPKIGTKIAEKLFEQIAEARPDTVVSGCPSCRDGVSIQKDILEARQDPVAEFNVAGIFEQIVKDHSMASSPSAAP